MAAKRGRLARGRPKASCLGRALAAFVWVVSATVGCTEIIGLTEVPAADPNAGGATGADATSDAGPGTGPTPLPASDASGQEDATTSEGAAGSQDAGARATDGGPDAAGILDANGNESTDALGTNDADAVGCTPQSCQSGCCAGNVCCGGGYYCDGHGACAPQLTIGSVCTADSQCRTGICGGRCCTSTCTCTQPSAGNLLANAGFYRPLSENDDWAIDHGGPAGDSGQPASFTWSQSDAEGCTYSGSIDVYVDGTDVTYQDAQFHDHCAPAAPGARYDFGGFAEVSALPNDTMWQGGCGVTFFSTPNCTGTSVATATADLAALFSPPDGGTGPSTYSWVPFASSTTAPDGAQSLFFGCTFPSDGPPTHLWLDMLYATKDPGGY